MNYFNSDEYVKYLEKNCDVSDFDQQEKTPTFTGADTDIFLKYLKLMNIEKQHTVLEIGCGLGRLLKVVNDVYNSKLYGIDLSPKLIERAKVRVGNICEELKDCSAENINYPDKYFDRIYCWAVFDLCPQEKSLFEMNRLVKTGGLILITGKSNSYCSDDEEAYSAEVAVTQKQIDHKFTVYNEMIEFASDLGFEPVFERFFERRGDFMKDKFTKERPEEFYEWLVILKKVTDSKELENIVDFTVQHSNTYNKKRLS